MLIHSGTLYNFASTKTWLFSYKSDLHNKYIWFGTVSSRARKKNVITEPLHRCESDLYNFVGTSTNVGPTNVRRYKPKTYKRRTGTNVGPGQTSD